MVKLYPITFLFFSFLSIGGRIGIIIGVDAQCSLPKSISESPQADGTTDNFNDADQLGGPNAIDKIIQIDVYAGNFWTNFVVTKICTTYKLTSGEDSEEQCNGNGGSKQGTALFPDGIYLTGIDQVRGAYVDYVIFRTSSGESFGPWGGKQSIAPNTARLSKGNSVIKSLMGRADRVVDRLRASYETNQLYMVRADTPGFTQTAEPKVIDDITFETPQAIEVNNNLNGTIERKTRLKFSEQVKTIEKTSVTNSYQYDTEVSYATTAGFDIKVFSASAETTLTVGASFSMSSTTETTHEYSRTFTRDIEVVAPPFTQVTAEVFFRRAQYEFSWTSPVRCTYTFNPEKEYTAIEGYSGTMAGSQAFPQGYVLFSEVRNENPPTPPTPTPESPPTMAPIISDEGGTPTTSFTDALPSAGPFTTGGGSSSSKLMLVVLTAVATAVMSPCCL